MNEEGCFSKEILATIWSAGQAYSGHKVAGIAGLAVGPKDKRNTELISFMLSLWGMASS